jgi:uncharacterized protein
VNLDFEWDLEKAAANLRKHGITFADAEQVFFDPFVIFDQDRVEGGEHRWQAIGLAGGVILLCVAHTTRVESHSVEVIRIISARRATRSERRRYEN